MLCPHCGKSIENAATTVDQAIAVNPGPANQLPVTWYDANAKGFVQRMTISLHPSGAAWVPPTWIMPD